MNSFNHLGEAVYDCYSKLLDGGQPVTPLRWQSEEIKPKMWQIFHMSFMVRIMKEWRSQFKYDFQWCNLHLAERIGGEPINPGEAYKIWPHYQQDEVWRSNDQKFSHTYMERIWAPAITGLRYKFGNLENIISHLDYDIDTRQAFLPIWFPEDTSAAGNERVPCTIGYLFQRRKGYLDVTYYIRSCDAIRHFKNDIFLTIGLLEFVINKLNHKLNPGFLVFHCANFHCFDQDLYTLNKYVRNFDNTIR
jgi:thymidylate synthase